MFFVNVCVKSKKQMHAVHTSMQTNQGLQNFSCLNQHAYAYSKPNKETDSKDEHVYMFKQQCNSKLKIIQFALPLQTHYI